MHEKLRTHMYNIITKMFYLCNSVRSLKNSLHLLQIMILHYCKTLHSLYI